ncbi:MAG: 2-amino-4-hydroxy-6-hydroxymethyldihydropteridine diphosphokinase [Anaerolineae bacterium]|nr:2-amino-4-hydroxy-6-hydroxymethyldihydropteridine diphosphokinase [Anaerolineae bacterium]MCB9108257.1 2-amino-4-hydroxy-6-hydroxymethyldihydropteridine diphosphokinase [Anaerolineales bacterium]
MTGERYRVFLALGTNLGQREANLWTALLHLGPEVEVTAVSRLYETAPAYVLDQPNFLNIALEGQTDLSPEALLDYLKGLEEQLGRETSHRYGPRLIDLDILFFEAITLDTPRLTIPHPRLAERAFVLRPLTDIAPDFIHPTLHQSIRELAAALPADDGILSVRPWSPFQAGDVAR